MPKQYLVESLGLSDAIYLLNGKERRELRPNEKVVLAGECEAALAEERARAALAERVLDVGFHVDHYCEQCARPIFEGEPRVLDDGGSFHCWRHLGDGKPDAQCVTDETFSELLPSLGRTQQIDTLRARVAELEDAVRWARGEVGEFALRQEGEGAFWWRKELSRRASVAYLEAEPPSG